MAGEREVKFGMMKRVALGGLIIMSSAVIWMVHDLVDRTVESRFEGTIAEPVRFRIDPNTKHFNPCSSACQRVI